VFNQKEQKMGEVKWSWSKEDFVVVVVLSTILWMPFSRADLSDQSASVEHYKMLSTVEYTGQGQFKHQTETVLT
jgi:hypothetical protein